jgi:hypothetical protein
MLLFLSVMGLIGEFNSLNKFGSLDICLGATYFKVAGLITAGSAV